MIETKGKTHLFSIEHHPLSKKKKFKAIALRVALGATGIIPLITLIGKIHLRRTHHFKEQAKATTRLSQDQKSIKDQPALQTSLPEKSSLPFKELQLPKTREEFFELIKNEGNTLTKLNLDWRYRYYEINDDELKQIVTFCPNLTDFVIDDQPITNIDALRSLHYLEFIGIQNCPHLTQGPDFSKMARLKTIDLTLCKRMTSAPKIQGCSELTTFIISNIPIQSSIDLSGLTKLNKAIAVQLDSKTPFILSECTSLEFLKIGNCNEMTNLPNLSELCSLKSLVITECHSIKQIPSLSNCEKLEIITIDKCPKLTIFPEIDKCKNLKNFYLENCPIHNVLDFSNFTQLENVEIKNCHELDKEPIFNYCDSLATIEIIGCGKLKGAINLTNLSRLKKIKISHCPQLTQAPIFENCPSLEEIEFRSIGLNEKLDLSSFSKLKKIKLVSLPEFDKTLDFTKCNELECVMLESLRKLNGKCYFVGLTKLLGVYLNDLKASNVSIDLSGCINLKYVFCNSCNSTILASSAILVPSKLPKYCKLSVCDDEDDIYHYEFFEEEVYGTPNGVLSYSTF